MGANRHHAIVVTSWDEPTLLKVHAAALALFSPPLGLGYVGMWVSPLSPGEVNRMRSFFVAPDGSKEGWSASDEGNRRRDAFVSLLRSKAYEDGSSALSWAEVQYGDDNCEALVTRSGDEDEELVTKGLVR